MTRFLVRRALWGVVTLFVFVTITFFAVHLVFPFDYVTQHQVGLSPEAAASWRESLGLDRPLAAQYVSYIGELATLSLGTSYAGGQVADTLWASLPPTLLIFAIGGIIAYLFGSWLGRFVAWQRRRFLAGSTTTVGVLAYTAFPPWLVFVLVYFMTDPLWRARGVIGLPADSLHIWRDSPWDVDTVMWQVSATLAIALVLAMAIRAALRRMGVWRWATALSLPLPFVVAVASWYQLGFGTEAVDLLFRSSMEVAVGRGSLLLVFLAFIVLAFGEIAFVVRTSVDAERTEQYVTTARAKGLSEVQVRERHVTPNAVLPAMSRFFVSVPYVLTGLIIIEREFAFAGLSTTFFTAVEEVDVPLILGTLVVLGVLVLVLRLGLEVAHAAIDPRIRIPTEEPAS
jgi:ABC-type dipeptide/oligopeptide/nickel transport system permease component